eukprot:jgi/Mesvir1/27559/Mv07309-RA.1
MPLRKRTQAVKQVPPVEKPVAWVEKRAGLVQVCEATGDIGPLKIVVKHDGRSLQQRILDSLNDTFLPAGYPDTVADGYTRYSGWRACQHVAAACAGCLCTQALLTAAGLSTAAPQVVLVSWVLKDGMEHVGKIVGSVLGPRLDSDPKGFRMLGDAMYDVGAVLDVMTPFAPNQFLAIAGGANFFKGLGVVVGRAARMPMYKSFARAHNIADIAAKGEALSVASNVAGLGLGLIFSRYLLPTPLARAIAVPALSLIHLRCLANELHAVPLNTLNFRNLPILVSHFRTTGEVLSPAEVRQRESLPLPLLQLLGPGGATAPTPGPQGGRIRSAARLRDVVSSPAELEQLLRRSKGDRFLCSPSNGAKRYTDILLHPSATGSDVVKGWLLASCLESHASEDKAASKLPDNSARDKVRAKLQFAPPSATRTGASRASALGHRTSRDGLEEGDEAYLRGYRQMEQMHPVLIQGLVRKGWDVSTFHTNSRTRLVWPLVE